MATVPVQAVTINFTTMSIVQCPPTVCDSTKKNAVMACFHYLVLVMTSSLVLITSWTYILYVIYWVLMMKTTTNAQLGSTHVSWANESCIFSAKLKGNFGMRNVCWPVMTHREMQSVTDETHKLGCSCFFLSTYLLFPFQTGVHLVPDKHIIISWMSTLDWTQLESCYLPSLQLGNQGSWRWNPPVTTINDRKNLL